MRILHVARRMLMDGGYLGLSMDAIAAELEYSKGTIYNHFPCKEEIILALGVQTNEKRSAMFEHAASQPGNSRQRLMGIGVAAELFVRLYPNHFSVERLIRLASIWEKTSEKRQKTMHGSESKCLEIVSDIVRDAVSQDDLDLPEDVTPESLVFGLWSQTFGAYSIIVASENLQQHGVGDPYQSVRHNINMILDGYGWTPTSRDYDYMGEFEQIAAQVFPEELKQISAS